MTFSAEGLNGTNFALLDVRVDSCVTVNALLQTVFFSTDTLNHGFITLMHKVSHVIAAHNVIRFNALIATSCLRWVGQWNVSVFSLNTGNGKTH
jgi:hypothetical protein